MNITVNVDDISLKTVVDDWQEDRQLTIADLVAQQIVSRLTADRDGWNGITRRVHDIRDEEIRAAARPVIEEALARPVRQTNSYGEATGPETTLSSLIADEARRLITKPADPYGRDKGTVLSQAIAAEVQKAFQAEIADAVKQARDAVSGELGQQIGVQITATVQDALRSRR